MEKESYFFDEILKMRSAIKSSGSESILQKKAAIQKVYDESLAEALREEIASYEENVRFVNKDKENMIPESQVEGVLNQKNRDLNNAFGENNIFKSLLDRQK